MGTVLGPLFDIPHVYDMHSSLPQQLRNFGVGNWAPLVKLFRWLERVTVTSASAVITIDTELEEYVRGINPRTRQMRIENCPIPAKLALVDSDLVTQLKGNATVSSRQLIVYTGTFERYQGLDLLLKSARLVKARNAHARFLLVGGKPHQIEQLRVVAEREGVEDIVDFVGTVPPDEALAFLDIADVLVSPRTGGAFAPLKIYSYLFSGKPIVATRIKAHELLGEELALLVEPRAEALAEGMLVLLEDEARGKKLGDSARQYALEHHNPAEYLARLDQVYRALWTEVVPVLAPTRAGQLEKSEV
jgi:glycosyltransferase involved in cell wall biosynthesis